MARPASTDTSTDRTVAPKQLLALIQDADQKKTKINTISGEMGERVKHACENGHLHRSAFSLAVKLYRMDELKREDFIRQMNLYVDICRAGGLFGPEHSSDLVVDAERATAEDERSAPVSGDGSGVDAQPLSEAAVAVAKGIKQLKPRKGVGGDGEGSYKIQ